MGDNAEDGNSNVVVVTGFGPFKHHVINASWEAVKLLSTLNLEKKFGIKLITEEIPVTYDAVLNRIPSLWKKYNPLLVVHVGVSSNAKEITLETSANRSGYCRTDVDGGLPEGGCCPVGNDDCIYSSLSIHHISEEVNNCDGGALACVSSDAGRYLCEFIYYTSLSINRDRTIFIHVPELGKPYTAVELAEGISRVIESMINDISQQNCIEAIMQ